MKIAGHPVHIMLVHFPSAFFPMDLICSIIGHYTGIVSFTEASFYAMSGGVVLGWLAVFAGAADIAGLADDKRAIVKAALIHGGINLTVVIVYTFLAYVQYKRYPALSADSMGLLLVKAAVISCMIVGNFLGGRLILKYKVAVEKDNDEAIHIH